MQVPLYCLKDEEASGPEASVRTWGGKDDGLQLLACSSSCGQNYSLQHLIKYRLQTLTLEITCFPSNLQSEEKININFVSPVHKVHKDWKQEENIHQKQEKTISKLFYIHVVFNTKIGFEML